MDCIFCKIVVGEIPSLKVYEDDIVIAFLDNQPVNIGHTLVVPKAHYSDCLETPDSIMADVMAAVRRVGAAAMKATGAGGFNVGINCGPVAGQVVMHTHVHVIPRFAGDGLHLWGKREIEKEKMVETASKIAAALVG